MEKLKRSLLTLLLALAMIITFMPLTMMTSYAKAGDTPAHKKDITDNNNGTYTLELSVTGDADTNVKPASNVNVLIVYDESQSMTTNVSGTSNSRADNAEDVVHDFIEALRLYQKTDDTTTTDVDESENIQVAIVGFGPSATTRQGWTSDLSGGSNGANRFFDDGVDGTVSNTHGYGNNFGTNWEAALIEAKDLLNTLDNNNDEDPTFVIFVTDGVCTAQQGTSGESPSNTNWTHYRDYYEAAADDAFAIEQRKDTTLYGIYAYGNEHDLLDDLIYYANTPNSAGTAGTHRTMTVSGTTHTIMSVPTNQNNTFDFGDTVENTTNYYNAGDTAALTSAISSIFETIVKTLGIEETSISDGTTNKVQVGTETAELLEVNEGSYRYWLSIPIVDNKFTRIDKTTGKTVTYTVNEGGKTVTLPDGNTITVNGTIVNGQLKFEWTEANELSNNVAPPEAKLTNGTVDWNLEDAGTLLAGVTYSVTFDVYPSQTTLDIVADMENDPYVDEDNQGAWGELPSGIKKYIDKTGKLATNTTASLTYSDSRIPGSEPTTVAYNDLDPVPNSAVEQMAITKSWNNTLDDQQEQPVTLFVTRDGDPTYEMDLNNDNGWQDNVYISIGIMGSDNKPLPGAEGHDFTFTEPDGEFHWWEIDVPVVHPMLINNVKTMLVKVDAKHPVPEDYEGVVYSFNNAQYYVDETILSLTAVNNRRSSVNLKKVVDGEDAPANATFPFTLKIVNSLAPANAPANDTGHDSDYWVWISVRDMSETDDPEEAPPVTDAVVSGATHAGGGWYWAKSGDNIVLNVKNGYSIRFNNLPVGSTYTITEGTLPDNFVFDNAKIETIKGDGTGKPSSVGQTTTGTIDADNTLYQVTYTNKYGLADINVVKVWDDANNQDGIRKTIDEFKEYLVLKADGNDVTEANASKLNVVPDPANSNNYIVVWTGLSRFSGNNEIEYTVEETAINGYTTTYTNVDSEGEATTSEAGPAYDHGTITNTHTPDVTSVTVTKSWVDGSNQDGIRPENLTLTLNGLPEGVTAPDPEITKNGDSWTYTWSGLPKKANGQDITYTVSEENVPEGYTVSGSPAQNTGTITNTHTPEVTTSTVTKVWSDNDNNDGKRPGSLTVTLYKGETETDITATLNNGNSWTHTETGLPKRENGVEIEYNWKEDKTELPKCYEWVSDVTTGGSTTITNRKLVPTKVQFSGTKVLKGRDLRNGEFEFLLKDKNGETIDTVTNAADGTFSFNEITYEEADTYNYTIVENNENLPKGVQENNESYSVTVTVANSGDGTLNATITGDLNSNGSGADFHNVYQPSPTKIIILGSKEVNDKETGTKVPLKGGEFHFTITGTGEVDADEAEPEQKQVTPNTSTEEPSEKAEPAQTEADEKVEAAAEEASAEAKEKAEAAEEAQKEADLKAAEAEEAQQAAKEASEEEAEEAAAVAEEAKAEAEEAAETAKEAKAEAEEAAEAAEEAKAEADKASDAANEAAEAKESPTPAPADTTVVEAVMAGTKKVTIDAPLPAVVTVDNEADGSITYGEIEFEKAGVYTYVISESGSMKYVDNETGTKEVKVVVDDDGNGNLKVTSPTSAPHFTFHNVYNTPPKDSSVTDQIPVIKELAGHDLKAGSFTFELLDSKDNVIATAKNDAEGNVTFPPITFTKEGDFTYKVREQAGSSSVISYDKSGYSVTAHVTNKYDGEEMEVEWIYEEGDKIKFINTWDDKVYIDPPVEKVVKGPNPNETYTFMLKANSDSYPMPAAANGASSMTMSITGAGTKEFGNIYFTKPGTYSYTVTEVAGSNSECLYDSAVYVVTATVTEDENYKLHVTSTYQKNGQSVSTAKFQFVNTYPDEPEEPDEPDTGDHNDLAGMLGLMASSALGLVYMFFRRRREELM